MQSDAPAGYSNIGRTRSELSSLDIGLLHAHSLGKALFRVAACRVCQLLPTPFDGVLDDQTIVGLPDLSKA